jgi:hypothetical protein
MHVLAGELSGELIGPRAPAAVEVGRPPLPIPASAAASASSVAARAARSARSRRRRRRLRRGRPGPGCRRCDARSALASSSGAPLIEPERSSTSADAAALHRPGGRSGACTRASTPNRGRVASDECRFLGCQQHWKTDDVSLALGMVGSGKLAHLARQ